MSRGAIYNREAYVQGKMLDHSQWGSVLPRNITPSDIDFVFEDRLRTRIMYCELSSSVSCWRDLQFGQKQLYAGAVKCSGGRSLAVLLRHEVPPGDDIDTVADIKSFQVMRFAPLLGYSTSRIIDGEVWRKYVPAFYDGTELEFEETTAA